MKPERLYIRARNGKRAVPVQGLYDTDSEDGLIKERCSRFLAVGSLPEPIFLTGIGGGKVRSSRVAFLQVKVLGKWCRYSAFVVPDRALDVDLLIGEDFLARYGLAVNSRLNKIEVAYPQQFERMTRRHIFVASPRGLR